MKTLKKLLSPSALAATAATGMLALSVVNVMAYEVSTADLCQENPLDGCGDAENCAQQWCFELGYAARNFRYWCCAYGETCAGISPYTGNGQCN